MVFVGVGRPKEYGDFSPLFDQTWILPISVRDEEVAKLDIHSALCLEEDFSLNYSVLGATDYFFGNDPGIRFSIEGSGIKAEKDLDGFHKMLERQKSWMS
ncbi:hypothetical protein OCH239_05330 [Roseivivax halodurans JCM 10272]|uniref:Uncharacterized protein n=1 Tax=Roseivivax halodurans JCM 10272 TaxID=1449350 RepID=X7EG30_9RHOB|nr:hypothetical protein OCH239_05330 [Roseivivax halodurans JCM 10272]